MTDVSPELNQAPPNKDQIRSGKNADKSIKGRLKRGVGKVILGTPLAALLISSGNIDNPHVSALNIKDPTPASSPLATHALEQGLSIEDYVQQKLTSALEKASLELEHAGIDFEEEVTLDEIKQIAKEAIPYLAEELNIEKVHVPSIRRGKGNTYYYNPIFRTDRIEIGGGPLFMKKTSVVHELVHAQRRTKPKAGNWAVSPSDEDFAETAAWAILTKQALNGDLLAKYTLTMNVLCNLNAKREKEEFPVCNGNSGYRSATMVMDALNGKSSSYGNVRLDGIVEFIKKDVLETNNN